MKNTHKHISIQLRPAHVQYVSRSVNAFLILQRVSDQLERDCGEN